MFLVYGHSGLRRPLASFQILCCSFAPLHMAGVLNQCACLAKQPAYLLENLIPQHRSYWPWTPGLPGAWTVPRSVDQRCREFRHKRCKAICSQMWLWVKNMYPKWSPGKWNQGLKPAVPWWFNFDPYPCSLHIAHPWTPLWVRVKCCAFFCDPCEPSTPSYSKGDSSIGPPFLTRLLSGNLEHPHKQMVGPCKTRSIGLIPFPTNNKFIHRKPPNSAIKWGVTTARPFCRSKLRGPRTRRLGRRARRASLLFASGRSRVQVTVERCAPVDFVAEGLEMAAAARPEPRNPKRPSGDAVGCLEALFTFAGLVKGPPEGQALSVGPDPSNLHMRRANFLPWTQQKTRDDSPAKTRNPPGWDHPLRPGGGSPMNLRSLSNEPIVPYLQRNISIRSRDRQDSKTR